MDPLDLSDSEIVEVALSEPGRFGDLFDRHMATVFEYLARRVGSDSAEELTADVFVVAFRRLDSFDLTRSSALPWLYGIAHNMLRRHRRSEYRRLRAIGRLPGQLRLVIDDDPALTAVAAADLLERVTAALSELPVRDREPLLLHVWESMSYEEIAQALGIPVGTVRSRINRSRRRLRELVGLRGQEPDTEPTSERSSHG